MSVKSLSELQLQRGGAALRARLKHIDDRLVWLGFLRLAEHASKFGISDAQGKIDIRMYRNLSATPPPERKSGPAIAGGSPVGTYYRPEMFVPLFDGPPNLDDLWLTRLESAQPVGTLVVERLASISHAVEPDQVRALLSATELRQSCKMKYQSMTRAETSERIICPHALIKASSRYHVRAFDFTRKAFVDFSLSRVITSSEATDQSPVPSSLDDDWNTVLAVELVPHPRLSRAQRATIATEFGMKKDSFVLKVRRAMLFYLLDEMRLLTAIRHRDQNLADGPIWLGDAASVGAELKSMEAGS